MRNRLFNLSTLIYTFTIFLFLYIPIGVLVAYSFNKSRLNILWTGFTFEWYGSLLHNTAIIDAFKISLTVALISTLVSAVIGTLAAVAMYRYHFKGKTALNNLLYVPVVIPEIVMGISLLAFFSFIRLPLGLTSLIITHIAFCIPFVVIVVKTRLEGFDISVEEAAMDLGANRWETFRRITLPIIMPGIISGALLAGTVSLDDVIISFFVAGPQSTTLPLKVYSMVKFGVSPEINALSTIMLAINLVAVLAAQGLSLKKGSRKVIM